MLTNLWRFAYGWNNDPEADPTDVYNDSVTELYDRLWEEGKVEYLGAKYKMHMVIVPVGYMKPPHATTFQEMKELELDNLSIYEL